MKPFLLQKIVPFKRAAPEIPFFIFTFTKTVTLLQDKYSILPPSDLLCNSALLMIITLHVHWNIYEVNLGR